MLQGSADQGYGNALSNALYGTSGDNLLDGDSGADAMYGRAGNDAYFVDSIGDLVIENLNEGSELVYSTVGYTLAANTENLVLLGSGGLSGTGNTLSNAIYGNTGANTLNGGAAADFLQGNAGNDTFAFNAGQANGDMVADFAGNGAGGGGLAAVRRLRHGRAGRHIHPGRRDQPMDDPFRAWRSGRDDHAHDRRDDRCERLPVHLRSPAVCRAAAIEHDPEKLQTGSVRRSPGGRVAAAAV